jgi:type II secretion system protein E
MNKKLIGQILIDQKKLTIDQLNPALHEQKEKKLELGIILTNNKTITELDLIKALSIQHDIPIMNISTQDIDDDIAKKIPAKFVYKHNILPINIKNNILTIAMSDPMKLHALDELQIFLDCEIKTFLSTQTEILKTLKKIYGIGAETIEQLDDKSEKTYTQLQTFDLTNEDLNDGSIINFVNQIIKDGYNDKSTDIHIEPFEDELIIRYRIDGILHKIPTPSSIKNFQSSIISRIKIMANMNIAETRLPQDGRIHFNINKENIDIRVSTLPTMYGESIDLRILPKNQILLDLSELGLSQDSITKMQKLITKTHGIILVTGPTGHGKTTTLYACLSRINTIDKKIITVEDPIEYRLKGINQIPVYSKIGLTFANGLRSILRQDPDIIMVGEIRDQETAEIAIRASLTGHLVFSTLHTNDSAGSITRLKDMGIEPYLLSSSIEAVIAQRLVRLVCPYCKIEDKPDSSFLKRIGLTLSSDDKIYKSGKGCEKCLHTGYKDRTAIYELLVLDEDMRSSIIKGASSQDLKKQAVSKGMITLRNDAWQKVKAGITTIEEVLKATQEEEIL